MLPADLAIEDNMKNAALILAPFLIVSHHIVFNFDERDLKSSMTYSMQALLQAADMFNYSFLKFNEHDDLEHLISNIMPQCYFVTTYSLKDIKE